MFISYRRTGGVLALLASAAVVLAATVLAAVVAAAMLIVALAGAAAALLARAVRPASWRHHPDSPSTTWPGVTIEGTAVNPAGASDEHDRLRMESGRRRFF
jgi:hypothetical protein